MTIRRFPIVLLQQVSALGFAVVAVAVYMVAGGRLDLGAVSGIAWASTAVSGFV